MEFTDEICKKIIDMSGKYSTYEVFCDWVESTALAISNTHQLDRNPVWEKREQRYMDIVRKHGEEQMMEFARLTSFLVAALDDEIKDVLGEVYMKAKCGSKYTGQFFTPFHVSLLMAQMMLPEDVSPSNKLMLNEPSTGGGGMILAYARALLEAGVNPQKCMEFVAQDLDWKGTYMTYVQTSLLGLSGIAVNGNTLSEPYRKGYTQESVLYTPAKMGVIF